MNELKWSLLNSARDRHAAEKIITWAVDRAAEGRLTIDALVWDTHDARHALMRRDDVANLHRMYYWLLSTTLRRPALTGAIWVLCPDENGLMHWASVHDVLDNAGRRASSTSSVLLWRRARRQYAIEQIVPTDSSTAPLIQVAKPDGPTVPVLAPGSFEVYENWSRCETDKTQIPRALPDEGVSAASFSRTDRERCHVLQHLNQRCKLRRMGVSLATNRGLTTFPPGYGLRFWLYRPQSDADRAPLRGERTAPVRQLLTSRGQPHRGGS